ncbi:uncharacterized protein LOC132623325 isoform X1 [Lycium barbarum]|uniref:uncharacterized protein LOC132623325 isoform X1 n=1 Tax=Lycium barbarum TaxID=112863 RepID=UPI00293F421D|nr:uncharacterized protein LOC132623325 isoform X1 [Lycium barbarum]
MSRSIVVFLLLFLVSNPSPCSSSFTFPYSNYHILLSLSHSLFSRVANLREARGDYHAADRARSIARILENGLDSGSFWNIMWSVAWDYDGRDAATSFDMSELNELLRGLTEFSPLGSDRERVDWINRNYHNLLKVSTPLFGRLRKVFRQSGEALWRDAKKNMEHTLAKLEIGWIPALARKLTSEPQLKYVKSVVFVLGLIFFKQGPLKEVIETLQKEVLEGDLPKDCLELGTTDLKGLLMVFKDISSKHTSTSSTGADL